MKNLYLIIGGLLTISILQAQTPEVVADVNPNGNEGSNPEFLTLFNDQLYFTAEAGEDENTLVWVTDGTSVEPLPDLPEGYFFSRITRLSDRIMFEGESDTDEKTFFYDGTDLTSFDIVLNRGIEYQGDIYYLGETAELGQELFKYDGTDTSLVADIRPGFRNSTVSNLTVFNDKLVFTANDGTNGSVLWEYDGTSVELIEDINPGYTNSTYGELAVAGDNLFFTGYTGVSGAELYVYDGVEVTLFEIIEGGAGSSPQQFFVYEDQLIFRGGDGESIEMFVHDGTTLTNLNINESGGSFPSGFTLFNDKVYFAADDGVNGSELMVYDGENVSLAVDINEGPGNAEIEDPFAHGPYLYFKAYNFDRPSDSSPENKSNRSEEELNGIFRFDGERLDFVTPDIDYSFDDRDGIIPAILDNYVYFRAESDETGEELFRMRSISQEAEILSFSIAEQVEDAVIDAESTTIAVLVPAGTDVTNLTPTINVSEFAEVDLSGGQDFTDPVIYTVTSEFGNTKEWTVTVEVEGGALGLDKLPVKIYPNPTEDLITIESDGSISAQLLDLNGKTLQSKSGDNLKLNVKNLPSGIYLLKLQEGKRSVTHRIIKTN